MTLEEVFDLLRVAIVGSGNMGAEEAIQLGNYPAIRATFEEAGTGGTLYVFQVDSYFGLLAPLGGDPALAESIAASLVIE
ncbi:MAG: hypothetical protein HC915_11915 [Anaerolineae bacterium]|nr:hypothetical protein [Anaerolineae bacterium]